VHTVCSTDRSIVCVRVFVCFSKLEAIRQCATTTNCESYMDGDLGRYIKTMDYICSADVKAGQ